MAWASPGAWSATTQQPVTDPYGSVGAAGSGADSSTNWYDPTSFYGGKGPTPTGPSGVPSISDYLQRMNFQIAYDYNTQGAGLDPKGAFANYARSQQDMIQRAYNAALVSNPDLLPQQFLQGYGNGQGVLSQLQQNFQQLPYQLRGEDPRQWGQGTMGWVPRI